MEALATQTFAQGVSGTGGAERGVEAGPNLQLSDISRFDHAVYMAQSRLDTVAVQPGQGATIGHAAVEGLDSITQNIHHLKEMVDDVARSDNVRVQDVIKLNFEAILMTAKVTFTTNIASKSADGVTQLFKQQG